MTINAQEYAPDQLMRRRQDVGTQLSAVALSTTRQEILAELLDPSPISRWRDEAVCAQTDPELFFPEQGEYKGDLVRVIEGICATCPVIGRCILNEVRQDKPTYGVHGATTVKQRTAWRKLDYELQYAQVASHISALRKRNPVHQAGDVAIDDQARARRNRITVFEYNIVDRFIEDEPLSPEEQRLLDAFRVVAVAHVSPREASEYYDVPEYQLVQVVQTMKARFNHLPPHVRIRLLDNDPVRTFMRIPESSASYDSRVFKLLGLHERNSRHRLTAAESLALLRSIEADGLTIKSQATAYHVSEEVIVLELARMRKKLDELDPILQKKILEIPNDQEFLELAIDSEPYLRATYYLLGLRDQGASRKVSRYEWLTSLRGIVRDGNRQARYSEELGVTHGAVTERVKSLKANLERLPHSVQDHILNNQQKPSIVELLPGTEQHVQACYELLGIDTTNKQNNPNPADRLSAFRRMLGGATKKQLACEYGVSYHNFVTILNKMHRRYNALSDAEQASIKAV